MFGKKTKLDHIYQWVKEINNNVTQNRLIDLGELLGNTKEMIKRNIIAGIFKGIGIGIGFTIITAIIIIVLQKIVKLNIPIIGEYVADIVEIVQKSR